MKKMKTKKNKILKNRTKIKELKKKKNKLIIKIKAFGFFFY